MKCFNHNDKDAICICINCGKALCSECAMKTEKGKFTCSENCENFIAKFENSIELIQSKTLKQNKISSYACYIGGTIFTLFGIFDLLSSDFLLPAIFLISLGIAFFIWGTWYLKVGKKSIS